MSAPTFAENLSFQTNSMADIYDLPALYTTSHYEVKVVYDPKHEIDSYGVINKESGVIENFVSNLTMAKIVADSVTAAATMPQADSGSASTGATPAPHSSGYRN